MFVGLYRGLCANDQDPEGAGRIQALVPAVLGPTERTGWALPCQPTGFDGTTPAPGEGVWIAFEGGDVDYPVWVGTWSTGAQGGGQAGLPAIPQPATSTPANGVTVAIGTSHQFARQDHDHGGVAKPYARCAGVSTSVPNTGAWTIVPLAAPTEMGYGMIYRASTSELLVPVAGRYRIDFQISVAGLTGGWLIASYSHNGSYPEALQVPVPITTYNGPTGSDVAVCQAMDSFGLAAAIGSSSGAGDVTGILRVTYDGPQ